MRLFFAVELPAGVQGDLARLKTDSGPDYRWVEPGLLHLTLAFLGAQPQDQLDVLERIGAGAAQSGQRGTLTLGDASHFGPTRAPRVLWVNLRGDVDALTRLHRELDAGLKGEGFSLEDRPFRPHITLARRRERAIDGAPAGWPPTVQHAQFRLDQLTLMESRLSPRGPTYTPLFRFPLGG